MRGGFLQKWLRKTRTGITVYYMSSAQRRTLVYSVRLSPAESNAIQQIADRKHLPASTLVRAWILDRLEQEQPNGG